MDKQTESGTQRQKRPLAKLTDSETDKVDCLSKYNSYEENAVLATQESVRQKVLDWNRDLETDNLKIRQ